jgi:hypothetical protein
MQFGRRKKDGRFYPKGQGAGAPIVMPSSMSSQRRAWKRTVDKKHLASLKTLENPMLYSNFIKKMEKLNGSFDEQLVDRTLEPEEALLDLKRKHPDLDIGLKSQDQTAEFRQFLDDMGIENEKVQNLIAMDPNPLSEQELANLSYALNNRPQHAISVDNALKAPVTKDVRAWMEKPDRLDLPGVDSPLKKKQG